MLDSACEKCQRPLTRIDCNVWKEVACGVWRKIPEEDIEALKGMRRD